MVDAEQIAQKINEIPSSHGMLLADGLIYFVLRHPAPSGLEYADSHKIDLPSAMMSKLHLVSWAELDRRIKTGIFDVVETRVEEDRIEELGLPRLYAHRAEVGEAKIFWGRRR
jgi:hypothetical protein